MFENWNFDEMLCIGYITCDILLTIVICPPKMVDVE